MEHIENRSRTTLLFVILTVLFLGGCEYLPAGAGATGFNRAARLSTAISNMHANSVDLTVKIDAAMVTIHQLVSKSTGSPEAMYGQLVREIRQIDSQTGSTIKSAGTMRLRADEYFQSWEADLQNINNTSIKSASQVQRTQLLALYDDISQAIDVAKSAFEPMMSDLNDMQQYLNLDLTVAGRASVANPFEAVIRSVDDVKRKTNAYLKSLDEMVAQLSPGAAMVQDKSATE